MVLLLLLPILDFVSPLNASEVDHYVAFTTCFLFLFQLVVLESRQETDKPSSTKNVGKMDHFRPDL